ncbi:TolC family protein [Sulfitobacter sp. TSTF-M16]|uniref:TolC family protein n=1 Tax=Sulfitobacter aestuariivivens TaxID=2766981 RepID=A0A927D1F1_9RHOB|nr:TolC family protein [Sulfitobacter aestuariivivens]
MGHGVTRAGLVCATAFILTGCLSDMGGNGEGFVSRLMTTDHTKVGKPTHAEKVNAESVIIQGLTARRSALPDGSTFDQVATSVLAAYSRAAEAELRAARLRSEAASKNWLPKIGPSISLTSLSSVVANLVVDQVLFDNGRLKGERAFAIADVEVAAVSLAQDTNARVHSALGLYTDAVEAREKAALAQTALQDMGHFAWIMEERVKGGVSDLSEYNVMIQKLDEIKAENRANAEHAATSLAELNAMSIQPLDDLRGVPRFAVSPDAAQPLTVTLAEAEKTRAIAAAKVERASNLPGLSAGGTVGEEATFGLQVKSEKLLGLGTGASLEAIEAASEAAGRRVSQANEDANRTLRKLEGQIAAKQRQSDEAAQLTIKAKENLRVFRAQFDAGQRQVLDVVGVYEIYARQQQAEVTLKYEAVRMRLEMAELLGVLADGDAI